MYVFFLVWTALFLQLLPPAVLITSPDSVAREVGQNVIFILHGTAMSEATWGVRDGNTNDLNPRLIRVFNPGGAFQDSKLNSTSHAGRVSFVGDLTRGQAWFKITNLNINDTNIYIVKIIAKGESNYQNIPIQLTVTQPVSYRPQQDPQFQVCQAIICQRHQASLDLLIRLY